jgi:quercetin dioxygenase-like cupin family protein
VDDAVDDPRSGQRWVFRPRAGDVLEADLFVSRGGYVRSHVHPEQEETFTGVSGTFVLDVAGERKAIGPGDIVVVPPRTPHGFADAAEDAHVLVAVRPALDLESYFRAFLGLSRDGRIRMPVSGLPGPLLLVATLMNRYRREIAAPGLPLWLQRAAWRILALVGRVFGRRASFPEYGAP